MRKRLSTTVILLTALMVSGCATGRYTLPAESTAYDVKADQALVIFMRPSFVGGAITSALFEIDESGGDTLIGIIGPEEKIAHYTSPGNNKRFMVISENADFMDANLDADKVYYAVVTPRIGVWRARFSIHPFKQVANEPEFRLHSPEMTEWLADCKPVTAAADSYAWAAENAPSITAKRQAYLQKWQRMPEAEKQWRRLEPNDGVNAPL